MSNKTTKRILLLFFLCCGIYLLMSNLSAVKNTLTGFMFAVRPITTGLVLAFVLNIPLRLAQKLVLRIMPKRPALAHGVAVALVYMLLAGVCALLLTVILPQLSQSLSQLYVKLPDYWSTLSSWYERIADKLGIREWLDGVLAGSIEDSAAKISEYTAMVGTAAIRLGVSVGKSAFAFILGVIFSIYLLVEKKHLKDLFGAVMTHLVKNKAKLASITEFVKTVYEKFSSFIGGQVLDAMLLGVLCALGLLIIKLPYPALIGAIIAVTALVPIVGSWVGGGMCALLILMENPVQALVFLVFIVVLQQLENNLLYPRIVGNALQLKGIWVLAGVTIGGALLGVWGMILGAPAAAVAAVYVRRGILRGNSEPMSPKKD